MVIASMFITEPRQLWESESRSSLRLKLFLARRERLDVNFGIRSARFMGSEGVRNEFSAWEGTEPLRLASWGSVICWLC